MGPRSLVRGLARFAGGQALDARKRGRLAALGALALLALPLLARQYYIHLAIYVEVFAILAMSLNLVRGFTGLFSLAQAAFFGIGAYAAALIGLFLDPPFPILILGAAVVTSLFGFLIAVPSLRLRGDYFAIATMGFGQIIRLIELNWMEVTRGPMGLPGIPAFNVCGYSFIQRDYYYLTMLLVLLVAWFTRRLVNSRYGRAIMAIREDEIAAEATGVNSTAYKWSVFTVSTFIAGMAGAVFATYLTFVSPDAFTSGDSAMILCMVVLGGVGTITGPILGAAVLVILPELLRAAQIFRLVAVGFIMVVAVLLKEGQLWPRTVRFFSKIARRRPGVAGAARGGTAGGASRNQWSQ